MSGYTTRQRTLVLAYLQRHRGRSFTAGEVHQALNLQLGRESAPARSTVFRVMRRLAQEGVVLQLPREGSGVHAYQMDGHGACSDSLHLKCQGCGRLTHLDAAQTRRLADTVRRQFHFDLDPYQSTLYGLCDYCRQGGKTQGA